MFLNKQNPRSIVEEAGSLLSPFPSRFMLGIRFEEDFKHKTCSKAVGIDLCFFLAMKVWHFAIIWLYYELF